MGHTAWAPEGRQGRSQRGPKGPKLETSSCITYLSLRTGVECFPVESWNISWTTKAEPTRCKFVFVCICILFVFVFVFCILYFLRAGIFLGRRRPSRRVVNLWIFVASRFSPSVHSCCKPLWTLNCIFCCFYRYLYLYLYFWFVFVFVFVFVCKPLLVLSWELIFTCVKRWEINLLD